VLGALEAAGEGELEHATKAPERDVFYLARRRD
jgi:hypothetical protein